MTNETENYISGTAIASENTESLVNNPEEEVDIESEGTHVTGYAPVGYIKSLQESSNEGKNKVDEVLGKVIKKRKSYDITFC